MASLNDICYEQIKDSFHYGIFGDFKLVVDKNTGCFNATKLCNEGGKKFKEWTRLEKSKKLTIYYTRGGISSLGFYEIKGDNQNETVAKTTGQYVQKELILDIASWISAEFYDKCSGIILDFFVSEFKTKEMELEEKVRIAEENMKKLSIDNIEKEHKINDMELFIKKMEQHMKDSKEREEAAEKRHKQIIGYAERTKDQLDYLTDVVEDHNEALPDKFADVVKPLADNFVKSPKENFLKARFTVLRLRNVRGVCEYRITRGQTRNVVRVKAEHPDAVILLDLPLVGAQDRMTEVRKQIRLKISKELFGNAVFRSSVITNFNIVYETDMLQTILDVHEQFQSIPEDMIEQARQELSIVVE